MTAVISSSFTRDGARERWAQSGLTIADLNAESLRTLRAMIDRAMRASGLMQGSYRAHQRFLLHLEAPQPWADLRCRSLYFNDRQAITFEPDGFVGFAGWADQWNVQPILTAFCRWVDHHVSVRGVRTNGCEEDQA